MVRVSLQEENILLRKRLDALEQRLQQLEERLPREQTIVLREISSQQAEEEISKLFVEGGALYYSDIAQKLRLDLELVVEVCSELLKKGEIQVRCNAPL